MSFEYEMLEKMDQIPSISAIVSDQEPYHGSIPACDVPVRKVCTCSEFLTYSWRILFVLFCFVFVFFFVKLSAKIIHLQKIKKNIVFRKYYIFIRQNDAFSVSFCKRLSDILVKVAL